MALAHPRVSLALWSWFGAAGVVTLTMTAASAQTLETPEAVGASSATELSRRLTAIAPAGQSLDAPPDRWLFEQPAKPPAIVKSAGDDGVATWADAPVTDADATAVGAIAQTPATNAEASEDIAVTDAAAVESIANAEAIAASLAVAPSAEATASAETDADTTAAATRRADASDTAQAPTTEAPSRVQGRVSLGYTTSGGGYDGFGRLEFFAPLYQNPTRNVAFAEGKLLIDNDVNFGGNLRVGYRQVINDGGRTVGGYVGFDQRSSGRNDFSQVGVGLETVGETWEVRANGYVPVGETRELIADGIVNPRFATNRLLYDVAQVYEAAIGGFDLEAGGRLLRWDEFGSLYGYVGPYFLTGEGIDDTWGIRSRVELEISDGVRFGAGIQHDDLFGTNGVFSITASAPRGANRPNRDEPDAEELALANLGQPVYRNDAILIDTQFETPLVGQVAINPVTGQPYTFIHVQSGGSGGGTFEAPFGFGQFATATSQAGTDGNFVVYANENQDTNIGNFTVPSNVQVLSTGPVQLLSVLDRGQAVAVQLPSSGLGTPFFPNITGTATLSAGSRLSGFDFTPSGGNSPTISFIGAGTTPVIPIAPTPSLCVPQTPGLTQVQNVNLNSSQANTAAIEVSGFSNVVICDSNIAMTGDSGVGIRVVNDGAATLLNNTVTTAGSTAPGIVAELEGQVTLLNNTVTTTGRLSPGVSASQDGQVTLDSNTILTTGLESPGVLASNDGQVTLANNAITTTNSNSPGVQADSDSAVTIASCQSITTSGRRSHGVLAINNGSVNIENCTITTNGDRANGIRLERNRDITIANNTVTTNGLFSRAITLNNLGGNVGDTVSIANNTVTTNGRISAAINLGDVGGTVSITNNTLQTTSGVNANGISVIQNLGTIDSLTISGNTIAVENNGTATDRVLGIILATDNTGRINNTTVADNTISVTGLSAGLEFNVRGLSTGFTGTTTVTGNTITGDTSGFNSGIVFDIAPNAFLGNGPFTVSNNQISTFDSAITSGSSRAGSFSNFSLLNNRLATLAASENVVDFRVDNGSFCFSQFSGNTATAGRFGFALARISGGTGIIQVIEPSTADDTLPTVRASNTGIGNTTGSFNFEAGVTDAVLACP